MVIAENRNQVIRIEAKRTDLDVHHCASSSSTVVWVGEAVTVSLYSREKGKGQ